LRFTLVEPFRLCRTASIFAKASAFDFYGATRRRDLPSSHYGMASETARQIRLRIATARQVGES